MTNEIERIALLPLRLGLRATRIVWSPVLGVTQRFLNHGDGQDQGAAPSDTVERPPSTWRPSARPQAPAAPIYDEPAEPEPEHVEVEEELVAQSADEGAEETPGAQISIAEPWDGYRRMKADEVLARIETAEREELAVVQLYEGMNRRRKTVLEAAERRLKAESGPAARR